MGVVHSVTAEPDTPLLYVLRNDLALNGAKFGCGLEQCGACTALVDGVPTRSCVRAIQDIGEQEITTIEGLGTLDKPHPLQKAFMDEQAAQCSYLHQRNDHDRQGIARPHAASDRSRRARHLGAQSLPLWHPQPHHPRGVLRAAQANGRI